MECMASSLVGADKAGIKHDCPPSRMGFEIQSKEHVIELQEHLAHAICHSPHFYEAAVLP